MLETLSRLHNRTTATALFLSAIWLGNCVPVAALQISPAGAQQGRQITLREQLTVGLRAYTKADQAFIDKVVLLVEQKKLPRPLVDSTFFWARQRAVWHSRTRRLRPIVYFQPGLIQRARRIGVKL